MPHVATLSDVPLRSLVAAVLAVALMLALAVPADAQGAPVVRLDGGNTGVGAAIAWSQLTFADGSANQVIIARDDDFADALTTGPVQRAITAPLLLTASDTLTPATAAEIDRLGASAAVIIGGTAAVSEEVEAELTAMGLATERLRGASRLETAVAVERRFFPNATTVVLARAFGAADSTQAFADTLGVGAYAAVSNVPVLLTQTDMLSQPTAEELQRGNVEVAIIVGGTSAVSQDVADEVDGIDNGSSDEDPGITVRRLSGLNRFATAVTVARDLGYASAADASRVILVEGQRADAWTGGLPAAAQAGNDAPIVLSNGDFILQPTFDFLNGGNVPLICGPNVTELACDKAAAALRGEGEADRPAPSQLDVDPSANQTATVSSGLPIPIVGDLVTPEDDSDDITYTATGLNPQQAYRVTLVVEDNAIVGSDGSATFVDDDDNGIADPGASEDVALITMVNGEPETVNGGEGTKTVPAGTDDPSDPAGVFPNADGTLSVTIDGVGPGSVYPVFYVNAGASTFLEIDDSGAPVEPYGLGGLATYS